MSGASQEVMGPVQLFPADRLAPELVHLIMDYLEKPDLANVRFLCRSFAIIGLQCLARTFTLTLAEQSYDRLLAIAEHPVMSKFVTSIECESDSLLNLGRMEWGEAVEDMIDDPSYFIPSAYIADERTERLYLRNLHKRTPVSDLSNGRAKPRMDDAFMIYNGYLADQDHTRHASFFPTKVAKAMKLLPNLETLHTSSDLVCYRLCEKVEASTGCSFMGGVCLDLKEERAGMFPFSSFLFAIGLAETKLRSFSGDRVRWDFAAQSDEATIVIKKALHHLQELHLGIECPDTDVGDVITAREGKVIDAFRESMSDGYLRDLVASPKGLERLRIDFLARNPCWATHFENIVGTSTWSCLTTAKFSNMTTTGDALVGFYARHAKTLKIIRLADVKMTEGLWLSTYCRMRQLLNLASICLTGYFGGGGGRGWAWNWDKASMWNLNLANRKRGTCECRTTGQVVGDYIIGRDGRKDMSLREYVEMEGWLDMVFPEVV